MARRKLQHFAEMEALPNVFQNPPDKKGQWSTYFNNNNPITLELGCGTAAYTLGLAERYPDRNFIGVDVKGARMWHGATYAHANGLSNVAFLRIVIENITEYFAPGEVSEIWVTFPDPHPREGKERKRLSSKRFFELYKQLLQPGGFVHLKTDNLPLFEYSIEWLKEEGLPVEFSSFDVHKEGPEQADIDIQTTYEKRYRAEGKPICYYRLRLG